MVERAIALRHTGNNSFLNVLVMCESGFAKALADWEFYAKHVEQIGWTTEKGMCLTMDAATTRLLKVLKETLSIGA